MEAITSFAQEQFVFSLIVGVIVLIYGGHLLVDGGVAIAKQLGISTLVIGLTVVAFSTSSPELALNIVASMNGNGELALGNVFGSNIANLGLVLGIGALICKLPVTGQVVRWEFPWLLGVTTVVGGITIFSPTLGAGWAALFLFGFCISMWKWFRLGKQEKSVLGDESKKEAEEKRERHPVIAWCWLVGGLVLLTAGGKLTEIGAVEGATRLGIDQIVIGFTIVAIATSLPEIVTTIIAAKKNHPDLAVGNVVGSNLFNILLVLPVSMFVGEISVPDGTWVYVVLMILMTLIAYLFTKDEKLKAIEGGVLLGIYFCFIAGLVIWKTMV